MHLCLLLCLVDIKLVLQGTHLAHHIILLPLQLFLSLPGLEISVLPSLTILPHSFSIQLGFLEVSLELTHLRGVLV